MKHRTLLMIDVGGALCTCGLLATVAWYAFLKPDTATSRVRLVSEEVDQSRADLSRLQMALDGQVALNHKLTGLAAQKGRLPTKSPVEQDLRTITSLAEANNVSFVSVAPTSEVRYPGVLELRYRVDTIGTYPGLLGFLAAFERCSLWADVTYMRVRRSVADVNEPEPICRSELTLSFFSAVQ